MHTHALSSRLRNSVISVLAFLAGTLVLAFLALITGAVAADFVRTANFMFVVVVLFVILTIVISSHENDAADRIWIGTIIGLMIAVSLAGGLGVFFKIFATQDLAKTILIVAVGVDAFLAVVDWFHTCYINDDYTV